ncbi:hypothetical protein B0H14DRAFT_3514543 [Mycena olivaceomarginata]|nr:hypothetical protein B0H14DRAFT_3514543 [Mycena olivaceomarginata]
MPLILAACPLIAHPMRTRYPPPTLPAACRPIPHPMRAQCLPPTGSLSVVRTFDLHHPRARSPLPAHLFSRACPLLCTLLEPFPAYCTLSSAVSDVLFSHLFYFSPCCTPLHLFHSEEGAKFGELGLQHIFSTNSPRYCSPYGASPPHAFGQVVYTPVHCGAGGTYAAASAPSSVPCTWGGGLSRYLRCCATAGGAHVNKCHPEALANAAAPDRCREQRRGAADLPIHIRWGAVSL